MSPSALEGVDDIEQLYASAKDLDTVFEHKTREEIQATLNTHFLGQEESFAPTNKTIVEDVEEDFIPVTKRADNVIERNSDELSNDDKIQDILKDL